MSRFGHVDLISMKCYEIKNKMSNVFQTEPVSWKTFSRVSPFQSDDFTGYSIQSKLYTWELKYILQSNEFAETKSRKLNLSTQLVFRNLDKVIS